MVTLGVRLPAFAFLLVILTAGLGSGTPVTVAEGLPAGADDRLRSGATASLVLDGIVHPLAARPHDLLASDAIVGTHIAAAVSSGAPRVTTFIGDIAGSALGVRLSLDPERPGVEGLILRPDGTGWLLLPRDDGGADVVQTLGLERHGIDARDQIPSPVEWSTGGVTTQEGTLKLRLALEVAYNYQRIRPSEWQERILEIVSYVELIYATQLDVVFEITYLSAWEEPDPYTSRHACWTTGYESEGKLEQFATYWEQHRGEVVREAAHLFVSSFGQGGFDGCAYVEALDTYGYGVSRAKLSVYTSREVALWDNINLFAHELGHNFGGYHEKSVGLYGVTGNGALYGIPPHTIMDSGWNGILRFSEADGVHSPNTGWELDNAGHMRTHAEDRLDPA